ncbi:crossover junction endodeoxyribonuclease RuvC [Shouchella clausii]|uniref:crossover junction endodeoxyribonuclease RuvC n=1 Tax=Shouchella clausii TaxID=79880 RepID=UPI00226CCB14|nr:crossover junction endodeoxyribonuclease RuvC [Shouchella clausii]MCY1105827.1 crossover junction endodeoxyribonuclease RuvC [Shouchella clausii]
MATKPKPFRILGLDLSITSPGFAVVDVKKGAPSLVTTAHFTTAAATPQALRYEEIEAFALLFIRDHMPFDVVVREIWPPSRNYAQNNKIHGTWASVERALHRYGYEVDVHVTPANVKKTVTGNGSAKKPEVAQGVRDILRLDEDYAFKTDDHSDAAAVALTYCVREKLITIGEDE